MSQEDLINMEVEVMKLRSKQRDRLREGLAEMRRLHGHLLARVERLEKKQMGWWPRADFRAWRELLVSVSHRCRAEIPPHARTVTPTITGASV